jgi:hypothetical protein
MRAFVAISIAALGMLATFVFIRWMSLLERTWMEADADLTTFQVCLVSAANWLARYWYFVSGALCLMAIVVAVIPAKRHESRPESE